MDARKAVRKQARVLAKVWRDFGIGSSEFPTKFVCICNAGLMNGLSEEELLEMMLRFGPVERLAMPAGKSYAFAVFVHADSAQNAIRRINGCETVDGRTLYSAFVDSAPTVDAPYVFSAPPGLRLEEGFVSEEEEQELLNWVKNLCEAEEPTGSMKHRRVFHFGYEFNYSTNAVDPKQPLNDRPIPLQCNLIIDRLKAALHSEVAPDQLTVNVYEPGQGIPAHVDTHSAFLGPIVSLSLGAGVCMQFRHPDGRSMKERAVDLPPRSLLVLEGEARYLWSHGIVPRKLDLLPTADGVTVRKRGKRVSLTFRKVNRDMRCICNYPVQCDHQRALSRAELSTEEYVLDEIPAEIAVELERNHVWKVYDEIAEHFSETRSKPWPGIVKFLECLPAHSILLDVGCGNGKYCNVRPDLLTVGCDTSSNLLQIAGKKASGGVFQANCLNIALRGACVDAAICIAVIHHLSTESRRRDALREICRILKPGCRGLVYVWAKEQEIENRKSHYLKNKSSKSQKKPARETQDSDDCVPRESGDPPEVFAACEVTSCPDPLKLPVHSNRTNFKHKDLFVPWNMKDPREKPAVPMEDNSGKTCLPDGTGASVKKKAVHHRFYHVFARGQLVFVVLEKSG